MNEQELLRRQFGAELQKEAYDEVRALLTSAVDIVFIEEPPGDGYDMGRILGGLIDQVLYSKFVENDHLRMVDGLADEFAGEPLTNTIE
jgi:hypothetical protein